MENEQNRPLTERIKEGLKEGFSTKAMKMHCPTYMVLGSLITLCGYTGVYVSEQTNEVALMCGHIGALHALYGAALWGIAKYRENGKTRSQGE